MRHITITNEKSKKEVFKNLAQKWFKWGEGLSERDVRLNIAKLSDLCSWWAKESVLEKVQITSESEYAWSDSFVHEPISGITHDYNLSISKLKSIAHSLDDEELKGRMLDAIKLNQKMFDTAYIGSRELSKLHMYYYQFNHEALAGKGEK